jgi:hypothetical protein
LRSFRFPQSKHRRVLLAIPAYSTLTNASEMF